MASLEEFVKCALNRTIEESYPHLKFPTIQYAKITKASQMTDTYTVDSIEITDESAGRTFTAHYTAHWYQYTLKVLDNFGNVDTDFPSVPGIESKLKLDTGALVVIGMVNGTPVIIGEVKL